MPRRQFVADLQKAQQNALPLGIADLRQGDDDGQIEFSFLGAPAATLALPVKVTAMVTDLGDYPKSHEYMIFCGDDAPRHFATALQNVRGTNHKTVFELLDIVSICLLKLSLDQDGDTFLPDSQYDEDQLEDDDDDDDIYDSDHEAFAISANQSSTSHAQPTIGGKAKTSDRAFRSRIRSDLLAAKSAGFKVGHHGHLMDGYNTYVTISIRMSKLGVSEEAMQAWQIEPSDYLILILQYQNGYKTNEELQGIENHRLSSNIGLKVCAGKKYKPTLQEVIKAFAVAKRNDRDSIGSTDLPSADDDVQDDSARDTFISKPLNGLLQERLIPILRFRSAGMDWRGAECHYDEIAKTSASNGDVVPDKYFEPEPTNPALADIVNADHYKSKDRMQYSFPLLAMQFVLRHFVRCTEYCLVCHRQLDTEVEAIKPYVCDAPLCLYQYMTLGFGPSIEHEILSQPYVVDLLVSFCYNSASSKRLKDYPDGLALVVPPIDPSQYAVDTYGVSRRPPVPENLQEAVAAKPKQKQPDSKYEVGFDPERCELIFFDQPKSCPVSRGNWIVIKPSGTLDGSELHCRVSETAYFPTISIDHPIVLKMGNDTHATAGSGTTSSISNQPRTITPATTPKWSKATFQIYEQDFEQLSKDEKCVAICKLLDTLPNVKTIQKYLATKQPADLKYWTDRISPAALSLLRWIIASNRACIMQVDSNGDSSDTKDKSAKAKAKTVFGKQQETLYGMKDYLQFRFAMGAPDKEQRFITEVRKTTDRLKLQYPTIFAWHGSPLYNWHMIIREGLHYKNIDHGRAFGNGVYHATDASTSTGYAGHRGNIGGVVPRSWPHSVLRIGSALALNEIVNAPAEFTSSKPYYVVQHIDWIQTRYLFVQCSPIEENVLIATDTKPINRHPQDPQRTPRGINDAIVIPAGVIKSGKAVKAVREEATGQSPFKKLKLASGGFDDPIPIDVDDDAESVATDAEDLDILFEEDPEPVLELGSQVLPLLSRKDSKAKGSETDFEPGTLDFSTLPTMPAPTYAVSATTKRLAKELQALQKIQDSSPLGDLGWYIDVEKIENVYQWIVELHSFHVIDPKLQLVADMKKQKVKSIVLEIRFNKDFPFTPPYVRVVRPRFLSRMQGGGGHIVMGGAMCMELLTNTGWSSVSSMESVLMQIRLAIASDPPARLDLQAKGDYGTGEAADGYVRACNTHGWTVPPGFQEMARGGGGVGGSA